MDILYLMILCSVSVAAVFLIIFVVNAKRGQFEDDESPAIRILLDDSVREDENDTEEEVKNDIESKKEEKS